MVNDTILLFGLSYSDMFKIVFTALLTGFGSGIGSYLAIKHVVDNISQLKRRTRGSSKEEAQQNVNDQAPA